jgi:LysR family transcriptional activator of mexEF-oprN operon
MKSEFTLNELRKMDLNLLLVLSVLVRERSVRVTAERLHVGSPAISMSLSRLRDLLHDPLLVRTGRGMTPTPRAQELAAMIDPFLQDLRLALLEGETFDPRTVTRTVRFAIADDLEVVLLPKLLRTLQDRAPGVRVIVRDADYHAIDRLLQSGDAEVVLAALLPKMQLREPNKVLYAEKFVALYDPAQVNVPTPLNLDEYLAIPQLLISPRGEISGMLEPRLQELGRARDVVGTLARFSTLPFVLKETRMLCNVPSTSARCLAQHFGLAISQLPFASPEFNIGIAWQHVLDQDPFTRWFTALITKIMGELRAGHPWGDS